MLRILLLTTALCAGVIAAGSASAAPMPAGNLQAAAQRILSDTVTPVHGYHRRCDRGYVRHWRRNTWHEHHRNRRVSECRPRREMRRDRRRPYRHRDNCINLGGVRICN